MKQADGKTVNTTRFEIGEDVNDLLFIQWCEDVSCCIKAFIQLNDMLMKQGMLLDVQREEIRPSLRADGKKVSKTTDRVDRLDQAEAPLAVDTSDEAEAEAAARSEAEAIRLAVRTNG